MAPPDERDSTVSEDEDGASRPLRDLSFVWICSRDEPFVTDALDAWIQIVAGQEIPSELIVVSNGLGDAFRETVTEKLGQSGLRWTVVNLHRPCSASMRLAAAFRHAAGDGIVLLPGYLQTEPSDVEKLIAELRGGSDYVASWRVDRVDSDTEQRRSRAFNLLTRWISGAGVHDVNCGLRAMRREVLSELPLYGDLHLFLPILAARRGLRVTEVQVRHLEERNEDVGNPVGVYLRRGLDLLTMFFLLRFTEKPFRFFGGLGTGLVAAGGLANAVLAIQRIVFEQPLANRPMLVLATLMVVLGIQMFSLGLLGELIIFVNAGGNSDYAVENVFKSPRSASKSEKQAGAPIAKIR